MFRNKLSKWFIPVLVLILAVAYYFYKNTTPSIDDIWVLNLDKDKERFQKILDQESLLPQKVNRWKATYGKDENREDAKKDGVSRTISTRSDVELPKENLTVTHAQGEIGCWLSHKRLLQHLNTLNVSPNFGHLVLEDDVVFDKDFLRKWNKIKHTIPGDWDFIYFGIGHPRGDRINENVIRWSNTKGWSNHGAYAYMVRHRALPHILKKIRFMSAAIDDEYFYALEDLNVYIIDPALVSADTDVESTIGSQQERF
jgi:hypothetical protein